ncbi:hypothetical protein TKK_0018429 [Trichogramma kaykai]|uniref:Polyglutamine-binding protein 1 n=1 Tax=Trichogramma kaykai TaxID=54128 RepID=A0ABD2VYS2_9HYME
MPLPAALLAKLAKRGIIQGKDDKKEPKKRVHEEIIAEDYDVVKDDFDEVDISQKFIGYPACPNKYNIYHDCSKKCKELWGKGHPQPSEKYLKRQMKLLQKYPLPETWKAVYDVGSGIHYYWDWSSDLVSWFPPGHPKCQISQPASQLREELHLKEAEKDDDHSSDESGSDQETTEVEEPKRYKKDSTDRLTSEKSDLDRMDREKLDREKSDRNRSDRHKSGDNRRFHHKNRENTKKDRTLDPMDPAAYSDIPRGKWSDGLVRGNEAKTGADSTASGPLYQMRPYPSPGTVLRSNKANKESDDKDEESE